MGKKLGSIILERRREIGLTLQGIASLVGVSYPAVQQWEKGKTNPGLQNIPRLAGALRMSDRTLYDALKEEDPDVGEIIYPPTPEQVEERRKAAEARREEVEAQMPAEMRDALKWLNERYPDKEALLRRPLNPDALRLAKAPPVSRIPIMGVAVAGLLEDADFYFNGHASDYIDRPPGLMYAKNVYAIYVISDSMSPRFEPNELLYVDADRPAVINDYAVIEMNPNADGTAGPGYVKRLKRRTADALIVEQFNPPKEFALPMDEVKSVHRIVPWRELLGV